MVGNCNNGIRRLGDEGNVPPKMKLLKQDLDAQLGAAWAGRTVWVSRYAAYYNASVQAHAAAAALGGPFMGWIVAKDIDDCKDYTYGGWYAANEVTTDRPPIVVEAIVYVDYKPYSVRAVYSSDKDLRGGFGVGLFSFSISDYSPEVTDALTAALHLANSKIAEQLRGH